MTKLQKIILSSYIVVSTVVIIGLMEDYYGFPFWIKICLIYMTTSAAGYRFEKNTGIELL